MGLGDSISAALGSVGVTPEAVSRWLGKPCGCEERKAKLNTLGAWAVRVLAGRTENAREYLVGILVGNE